MTLSDEVHAVKLQLSKTSKEFETFEQDSQQLLDQDHSQTLSHFQLAVKAIENTLGFLDFGQKKLTGNASDHKAAVQTAVASLNLTLDTLRKSADAGLTNVKAIDVQCHELDNIVDRIRINPETIHRQIVRELNRAEKKVKNTRAKVEAKTKIRDQEQSKLEELNEDMMAKKDERNGMRVVSFSCHIERHYHTQSVN